ncbi:MAG: PGF-CTERM sorting domain-containing protein [Methanosarcinaceae archaeon]|nr:PGF-CTERM sorting domain-containing protein [Methanosarcinaceae archaeon]
MNKKITAVTLTALMVLTMFTAMVPSASAAVIIDEVSAPYEFIGAVEPISAAGTATFDLTSANQPSILYFDFEEGEGDENLYFEIYNENKINSSTFEYDTTIYPANTDSAWAYKIAWLGQPYVLVDNESDMVLGELLFDEDDSESHLLRVGESLALPEGFSVTAQEIDVEGKEAWFFVSKDGEELYSTVTKEFFAFNYEEDLNNSNKKDNTVMSFTVEVVFAGMNTNMVKINNVQLISADVITVESGDTDTVNDYEIDHDKSKIWIVPYDNAADDYITLSKGGTKEIMDRFNVKINDDGDYAGLSVIITESGLYDLYADVEEISAAGDATFTLSSSTHPSVLVFDFEEGEGDENLYFEIYNENKINSSTFEYNTTIYPADIESAWAHKIAWLGQPYVLVDNESDMVLGELLFDEDSSESHLLRVGESLALPEGFSVTAQEIDVEGQEAWFFVSKDGEELYSTVTKEFFAFNYEEDLNNSNKKDNTIMSFAVEVVFAGMNTNMVKINNVQLISPDVITVESGDTDTVNDYEIDHDKSNIWIVPYDNAADDYITLSKGGTKVIMDRFNIRINDDGDYAAVVKVVEVGGGPVATATATTVGTEEPTEPTTNVTVDGTAPPTAPTDAVHTEPTPEPTKEEEPGFEAVFAVAGLLAVAYLVLRQRE